MGYSNFPASFVKIIFQCTSQTNNKSISQPLTQCLFNTFDLSEEFMRTYGGKVEKHNYFLSK